MASTTETTPPLEPTVLATLRSIDASQPGSPPAIPAMAELRSPGARTCACSRK